MSFYRGAAKRVDDIDIPRIGSRIGVGEDELQAVMDVEARSSGFDRQGRVAMLFEPHIFWRELGPGRSATRPPARESPTEAGAPRPTRRTATRASRPP